MNKKCQIRPIRPTDNEAVAGIIRDVMTEFGATGCGFSILDPSVIAGTALHLAGRAGVKLPGALPASAWKPNAASDAHASTRG